MLSFNDPLLILSTAVLALLCVEIVRLLLLMMKRKHLKEVRRTEFSYMTVVIPVRNEEKRIGNCLQSLVEQDYPHEKMRVIVVNDHSTDDTVMVVNSFQNSGIRLILLHSMELPPGWSGKSYACHRGALAAEGEFICFMDADVMVKPNLFASVLNALKEFNLDVLSLSPLQEAKSWYEKILLIPVFIMFANSFRNIDSILNGQFLFFKKEVYDAVGGHTIVRNTVAEDLDFAEHFRKTSYRTLFLFAEKLLACRMYDSFRSLQSGISKMIVRIMSNSIARAVWLSLRFFLYGIMAVWILFLVFSGHIHPMQGGIDLLILGLPLILLIMSTVLTFYFKIPWWFGFLLPVGWIFQPWFFFRSIRGFYRKYYEWRGRRVYHT